MQFGLELIDAVNCYEFMTADNFEMKFSVTTTQFTGDLFLRKVPGNRRQKQCNHEVPDEYSAPTMRMDAFCNRFKLVNLWPFPRAENTGGNVVAYLTLIPFGPDHDTPQPRPWDSTDPFYARAAAIWDSKPRQAINVDLFVYVNGAQYLYYAYDLEFKNDASQTLYSNYGNGTITLKIAKK